VDDCSGLRDLLAGRRTAITPERAGLLPGGGRRRLPGLRREEGPVLAGVSDWHIRPEKGAIAGGPDGARRQPDVPCARLDPEMEPPTCSVWN